MCLVSGYSSFHLTMESSYNDNTINMNHGGGTVRSMENPYEGGRTNELIYDSITEEKVVEMHKPSKENVYENPSVYMMKMKVRYRFY